MVIEPRDRHIDDLTNDATPEATDHQQIVRHVLETFDPRSRRATRRDYGKRQVRSSGSYGSSERSRTDVWPIAFSPGVTSKRRIECLAVRKHKRSFGEVATIRWGESLRDTAMGRERRLCKHLPASDTLHGRRVPLLREEIDAQHLPRWQKQPWVKMAAAATAEADHSRRHSILLGRDFDSRRLGGW
ncbi:hypothetical protein V1478_018383 [Vespula squamosa]|uniref:Uncharacterized protein n=1 Tax=Vespula squamosa TaxID=30214 RepID=A0ABD1ZUX7_VESSQ